MNPEIQEAWAQALESEEFPQSHGGLCVIDVDADGDKRPYCCLGVLTELYRRAHPEHNRDWMRITWSSDRSKMQFGEDSNFLPLEVQEWAGLSNFNPITNITSVYSAYSDRRHLTLSVLNDGDSFGNEPHDFVVIAQAVRDLP